MLSAPRHSGPAGPRQPAGIGRATGSALRTLAGEIAARPAEKLPAPAMADAANRPFTTGLNDTLTAEVQIVAARARF
jgi:hypothetical protein